jgi:hypothetical protein
MRMVVLHGVVPFCSSSKASIPGESLLNKVKQWWRGSRVYPSRFVVTRAAMLSRYRLEIAID